MTGRPSIYSDTLATVICERLSHGEPLARICDDSDMPSYSTVRRWEAEREDFRALSARAKLDGTHYLADQSLTIVDEELPADPDEAKVDIAHRKLRVDTRLRLIGKWNRQDYGDKQQVEHSGGVQVTTGPGDADL